MYTPLIQDQPEKRSRGKVAFTLPLVFLFILVGVASTRHLLNVNANNSLESMLADSPNASSDTHPTKNGEESAVADGACTGWWCIDTCHAAEDCKVVMTLDMGSSGTKPSLWAIKKEAENKKVPDIHMIGTNEGRKDDKGKDKGDAEGRKFGSICGIWSDKNQFNLDKVSHCKDEQKLKDLGKKDLCEKLSSDFDNWKTHFKDELKCFLEKKLHGKPISDYIVGIYGGVTAGLRNDPQITTKFSALEEQTGPLWEALTEYSGKKKKKPVHIRMLSGEEESYYEWLSFNWETLRKFTNEEGAHVQGELKNTFTVGGASTQIAIPTAKPMNTLDNTFYFHIGVDKYWVYANSIMWGGSTRLKTMVKDYTKGGKTNDDFFTNNNNLLCSDHAPVCDDPPVEPEDCAKIRIYKGLCVMGFHFPTPDQWLTEQFVGNRNYPALKGKCMEQGTSGTVVKLDFNDKCDDTETLKKSKDEIEKVAPSWWNKNNPKYTLPFYGRFWHQLKEEVSERIKPPKDVAFEPEYMKGEEKSWGVIWATMWMHGRFQGFTDLKRDAAETAVNGFRRNLGGLKGEYILGPLTIPAHFGTPEDKQ